MSFEIILASKSPRRAELLKRYGADFDIYVPEVEELTRCDAPADLPMLNAELKCSAVADVFPEKTVIGADTVILFDNMILGKPADRADAVRMLAMLSGKQHQVITGCAVICRKKNFHRTFKCVSDVVFKYLTLEKIEKYINDVYVLDKAGAYAIQEHGEDIIESYTGSLDNIIGLPVNEVGQVLQEAGIY